MDHGAIRDDADVGTFADHARASKRDREVRAGIGRTVCRVAGTDACVRETAPDRAQNRGAQEAAQIERR